MSVKRLWIQIKRGFPYCVRLQLRFDFLQVEKQNILLACCGNSTKLFFYAWTILAIPSTYVQYFLLYSNIRQCLFQVWNLSTYVSTNLYQILNNSNCSIHSLHILSSKLNSNCAIHRTYAEIPGKISLIPPHFYQILSLICLSNCFRRFH